MGYLEEIGKSSAFVSDKTVLCMHRRGYMAFLLQLEKKNPQFF